MSPHYYYQFTSVTADSSPLYTYVGYKPTPDMKKTHIIGNSAFQCHLECDDDGVVGLRVSNFTLILIKCAYIVSN